LLAVGADSKNTVQAFGKGATYFEKQQDLIDVLKQELKGDETILIKAHELSTWKCSRSFS